MAETRSPTGCTRRRKTSRTVRFAEGASRALITAGGIGTIVAVVGIFAFLVFVVVPLFGAGEVEAAGPVATPAAREQPLHLVVDEYRLLGLQVTREGRAQAFRLDTGETVVDRPVAEGPRMTAWAFGVHDDSCAFGFADGTVRVGNIGFAARSLPAGGGTPEVRRLPPGSRLNQENGVLERLRDGELRLQEVRVSLEDPVKISDAPVVLLAFSRTSNGSVFAAMDEKDVVSVSTTVEKTDLLTGKVRRSVRASALPYERPSSGRRPSWILLSGVGDTAYLAWDDGRLVRYDARDRDEPKIAETLDLVEEPGRRLTALTWVLGQTTLLAGDDLGRVRGWFPVRRPDAATSDGARLVPAHDVARRGSPVVLAGSSTRGRTVVLGFEDGTLELVHVTNEKKIVDVRVAGPLLAVAIAPKDDGLVAVEPGRVHAWGMDPGHPEASVGALFGRVWYEGYPEPEHVWQSTSGSDDFEPKLGLVPLVFGTLKATFYAMLFGVPLALLAALYTSEFLHPRLRTSVKSTIEIMASLPSVVLGFLAALVIAPFVQGVVPSVLAAFATIPFWFFLGGHLWQLLPQHLVLRLGGGVRFLAVALLALPIGLWTATTLGPWIEERLFAGDIGEWLDHERGDGVGGWALLLLPLLSMVALYAMARFVNPWLRGASRAWSRRACAAADLARFLGGAVVTVLLVWGGAQALGGLGLDPRGSLFGTYVQQNALVVGFMMGFAIIPIIYTLAEDALTSVPRHLREASLGAGATPWQTALRIIVPTAMSGLFSATMIGLGRAVGETMIVLMAAGNTPLMEWNPFSGFRSLATNIATELSEADPGGTHYRTLFLAALTLFAMTFVVNTIAERVRQRFRKRAFQL